MKSYPEVHRRQKLIVSAVLAGIVGIAFVFWPRAGEKSQSQQGTGSDRAESGAAKHPATDLISLAKATGKEWEVIEEAAAIGHLPADAKDEMATELRRELRGAGDSEVSAVDLNAMLNLLRTSGYADPEFLDFLRKRHRDKRLGMEQRDYAIQQSGGWLFARSRETGQLLVEDPSIRAKTIRMLIDVASTSDEAFAGTALTTLADIADFHADEIDSERLDQLVIKVLTRSGNHVLAKVSAAQVVAERELSQALPVIRVLANAPDTTPSLRLAAIAALGRMGADHDLEQLHALDRAHRASRYTKAIGVAIGRVQKRTTPELMSQ